VIADNIRHPGSQHEWLMVAEARKFKRWGVSMRAIQEGRTFTDAAIGKRFRYGGSGSGAFSALSEMPWLERAGEPWSERVDGRQDDGRAVRRAEARRPRIRASAQPAKP
jgi:hypothetical protein